MALHVADTIAAGDGLCDAAIVVRILREGPDAIDTLARLGVPFDRDADGALLLGLEAAHARRRIVHAGRDGTGREIMRALVAGRAGDPEHQSAGASGGEAARAAGRSRRGRARRIGNTGEAVLLPTRRVVLATGGIGGLFEHTTNPSGSIGHGLMLAAQAGAVLADPEFVQFHPTALDSGARPLPLVSEAVRGEGAILIDETGERFMAGQGRAELEPRDVVARAVWRHGSAGHRVFLDARHCLGPLFARRFPGIDSLCRAAGVDPATQPIPVRAAAHYHMGGVAVDAEGRSTVPGLWACGEVASTGLHGANRLASNSLLEAAATARWVAASVADMAAPVAPVLSGAAVPAAPDPAAIRPVVTEALGLERSADRLARAVAALLPQALRADDPGQAPASIGLMMAVAALQRAESRGAHYRRDAPEPLAGPAAPELSHACRCAGSGL